MARNESDDTVAKVVHVVTDQGNGSAYCGACWKGLPSDYGRFCPHCKRSLIDTPAEPYPFGGQDSF